MMIDQRVFVCQIAIFEVCMFMYIDKMFIIMLANLLGKPYVSKQSADALCNFLRNTIYDIINVVVHSHISLDNLFLSYLLVAINK
jgi:hypothetical protein